MARAFSTEEKEQIREQLQKAGKQFFIRQGVKKTSIQELTSAVGISQGAFYTFYPSKEVLFFDLLQQEEKKYRESVKNEILHRPMNQERFTAFLLHSMLYVREHPILQIVLIPGQWEQLVSRLPKEMMELHIQRDENDLVPLIKLWQEQGVMVKKKPEVIVAMIRAYIIMLLHEQELGEENFEEVMCVMAESFAKGLILK